MAKNYETLSPKQTLENLTTKPEGLSSNEVHDRTKKFGANVLAEKKKKGPFLLYLQQFNDPLIYILLVAGIISILLHEVADSTIIFIVVIINTIIGYIQQARAEKAMEALKKMTAPKAMVRRDNTIVESDSYSLVPGDILVLDT